MVGGGTVDVAEAINNFVGSGQSIRLPAGRVDHDGVFAEQARRIIPAPAAMMPRTKIGRSRAEVDARECADMIFGECPEVLRADRGIAPKVGYSAAAHKAAAKSTTDVSSGNSTRMTTAKATIHVTATKATSDMATAEATSHVATAEATSAKSATASGVGDIDA
jgi:hypothetical protein